MNELKVLKVHYQYHKGGLYPHVFYYKRKNSSKEIRLECTTASAVYLNEEKPGYMMSYYAKTTHYQDSLPVYTSHAYSLDSDDNPSTSKLPILNNYSEEQLFQLSLVWEHHFSPELLRAFQLYVQDSALNGTYHSVAVIDLDGKILEHF